MFFLVVAFSFINISPGMITNFFPFMPLLQSNIVHISLDIKSEIQEHIIGVMSMYCVENLLMYEFGRA